MLNRFHFRARAMSARLNPPGHSLGRNPKQHRRCEKCVINSWSQCSFCSCSRRAHICSVWWNINGDVHSNVHRESSMRTTVILMGILCPISFPACRKVIVRDSTQLLQIYIFFSSLFRREKRKNPAPFSSASCIPNTELQSLGWLVQWEGPKHPLPPMEQLP